MRLQTEATKAETEAAKETERMRIQADAAEKADKLKYEAGKERRDAEANKLKLEAETVKARSL